MRLMVCAGQILLDFSHRCHILASSSRQEKISSKNLFFVCFYSHNLKICIFYSITKCSRELHLASKDHKIIFLEYTTPHKFLLPATLLRSFKITPLKEDGNYLKWSFSLR